MSTALQLSLEEYDRMIAAGAFVGMDRHIELIRGELRQMNPAGPVHGDLIMYLLDWSHDQADRSAFLVTGRSGVNMPEVGSRPEPDVFWIHRRRYRDRHPGVSDVVLAIEVADSSLQYDLGEKADLYAEAGLAEYWVFDVPHQRLHVMREPTGKAYNHREIFQIGDSASPSIQPTASLDLQDLFEGE